MYAPQVSALWLVCCGIILSHRVEREDESKDPQACHVVIISRLLGCSSCDYTIESPEILPKLLMSWVGPQGFWFNWPGVWSSSEIAEVFQVILVGKRAPLRGLRGRQGGRRGQQKQRPWVMSPDILPSLFPVPQGGRSPWVPKSLPLLLPSWGRMCLLHPALTPWL